MIDESGEAGVNAGEGLDEILEPRVPAAEAAEPAMQETPLSARVLLAHVRRARHQELEQG